VYYEFPTDTFLSFYCRYPFFSSYQRSMEQITQTANVDDPANLPARFAQLKRDIAASNGPDFEANAIRSWAEIIDELAKRTKEIAAQGSDV
jgi:inhibitor of KinA sporulation pathway (predicted exonuclease)